MGRDELTAGLRSVELTAQATEALAWHKVRLADQKAAAKDQWQENDLVFPNAKGGPMDANNLRRRPFKALLEKAKLPDMPFHSLRHTVATMLLSKGTYLNVVQEMLGHADPAITLGIYGHVLPNMQREVVDNLHQRLSLVSSLLPETPEETPVEG